MQVGSRQHTFSQNVEKYYGLAEKQVFEGSLADLPAHCRPRISAATQAVAHPQHTGKLSRY